MVVIDATDTDVYIAAAYVSHQLHGMLCIKRKQETILYRSLVSEDMARCIVQLIILQAVMPTQGKSLAYDKVTRSAAV